MKLSDSQQRVLHTFWQAFLPAIGVEWAASGLDVRNVTDLATAEHFALAGLTAVGAAALAAGRVTLANWRQSRKTDPVGTDLPPSDAPVDPADPVGADIASS